MNLTIAATITKQKKIQRAAKFLGESVKEFKDNAVMSKVEACEDDYTTDPTHWRPTSPVDGRKVPRSRLIAARARLGL